MRYDNPAYQGPYDNALYQGGGANGGTITDSVFVSPPLVAQLMTWNGQAGAGFVMSIDEIGAQMVMQLLHTPLAGQLAPAPIAGGSLVMHLRPLNGVDIVMVSAPVILYAPYAMVVMTFQATDMALLLPGTIYKGMVRATFIDGQVRDFCGLQVTVNQVNP